MKRQAAPDQLATSKHLQAIFACCLLILTTVAVLYLAFLDRGIAFDEVGLHNAPYMFLHYGRVTYPIHGQFDEMVVHPPIHYIGIGLLMKFGLSLFHAAAVTPILFFALAGLLLLFSRMHFPVKFGLLFGVFLGALVWNWTFTVRPDLSQALAWIAGLIALETGRLADWDLKRLSIGGLLLGYASVVHYPGVFCWTGVLVYVVWAWRSLPLRQAVRPIAAMLAGLCLIGLPFLFLFVIPFRADIAEMINQHQGEGGVLYALKRHIEGYGIWAGERAFNAIFQPLVQTLLLPLWYLRVPAAFAGPPLLFAFRSTRGLALAALPQVLFIVFAARHKQLGYTGYFIPEIIVYLAAVISVLLAGMFFLLERISSRALAKVLLLGGLAGFTALALHDKPVAVGSRLRFTWDLNDLDQGRAAGRDIVGADAFIGTTGMGAWYTGGAAHYYSLANEILYAPTLAGTNLKQLFSRFDGLVMDAQGSWDTWNKERIGLNSLYVSGDLQLKGFWFSDRRSSWESGQFWMMYASAAGPVRGYAAHGRQMYRFDQAQDGDSVFFCAVCPIKELNTSGQFDFYGSMFFPLKTNADPRSGLDYGHATPVIRMMLGSKEQFQRDVLPAAARCKVRDQIAGRMVKVDTAALLAQLRATDHPIRFYRTLPQALAGSHRLNVQNTNIIPGATTLKNIHAAGATARVEWRGSTVDIRTPFRRWFDAAYIPVTHADGIVNAVVYVRGTVLEGLVGISVRDRETDSVIGNEAIWGPNDGVNEIFIPVAAFDRANVIALRNQRANGQSEMLIDEVAIVQEKPGPH